MTDDLNNRLFWSKNRILDQILNLDYTTEKKVKIEINGVKKIGEKVGDFLRVVG